jgi:hypothetical protein
LAVIQNEEPTKLHKELKGLYNERSRAAHGSAAGEYDLTEIAARSRFLLAKAILGTVRLSNSNKFGATADSPKLARAIELLVRSRVHV